MPEQDEPKGKPKKSTKQSKRLTSSQLKAAATKAAPKEDKPQPPPKPGAERQVTATHWARGRNDAITRAFVGEHERQRTVKRAAAEWAQLYADWLKQPRG
jgi:hypothetical protein